MAIKCFYKWLFENIPEDNILIDPTTKLKSPIGIERLPKYLSLTNLRFIYPKSNKHLTNTEELKISLVTDTYEQILSQFNSSKNRNKKVFEKNLKKFA